MGRNGAGKTTTLKTVLGLTPARSGTVHFDGIDITGRESYDIANLGIGFVPEHRAIFSDLTVEENLRIAERSKGDLEAREELIFGLFPDLKRFLRLSGTNLSGGQQQMLAVARALVPDNRLLLIDEPSEGLAPVIIEHMMEAIRQLSERSTVLLVEQNFIVASHLATRYVIVEEGRSVHAGDMADLVNDPDTIQRYLGAADDRLKQLDPFESTVSLAEPGAGRVVAGEPHQGRGAGGLAGAVPRRRWGAWSSDAWFGTIMQGLSVGAITFLVASGLSLIFGLMDVLNLAHGELFMLGAYVGWTVYTRFDTVIDVAVPILLIVLLRSRCCRGGGAWRSVSLPPSGRAERGRGWRCWSAWRRP